MNVAARTCQITLTAIASDGGAAEVVAQAAVETWQGVHAVLSPIIGSRGVGALFARSLHLTLGGHPWMIEVRDNPLQPLVFVNLHVALSARTADEAAAAHGALLQAFYDLLNMLIGESLTERLLQPVLDQPSSGSTVQDTTP